MTGVITTVPGVKSIYIDYLPDVCSFIPESILPQLGAARKKKGFTGTRLVTQVCVVTPPDSSFTVGASVYINNLNEVLSAPNNRIIRRDVPLPNGQIGVIYQKDGDVLPAQNYANCRVAWGTFYGSGDVEFDTFKASETNVCDRALNAAQLLVTSFPSKPIEMRPS